MQHLKEFSSFSGERLNPEVLVKMLQEEFPEYEIETDNSFDRLWVDLMKDGTDVASFSIGYTSFGVPGWIEAINASVKPLYRRSGISRRAFSVLNKFVKMSGYKGIYGPQFTEDSDFERSELGEILWKGLEAQGLARAETHEEDDDTYTTYYYIG